MGPRIYPADQNVSQLLPTPTPYPGGTVTPTPTPTNTPTPTPLPSGIPIITSGLTLYMDGQSISYPGTGTTWYNQVTTGLTYGDSTLAGNPSYNLTILKNYFGFNGLNDYTFNTSNDSPDFNGYYWTFGGWVRFSLGPTTKILYQRGVGLENAGIGFYGASLILYKDSNDYLAGDIWNNVPASPPLPYYLTGTTITSSTKLPNDTWVYVIMRYNYNSNAQLFINGVQVATGSVPSQGKLLVPSGTFYWNGGFNTGNYTPATRMNIGDFEIYNRSLSNAEVLSNYNVQSYKYI